MQNVAVTWLIIVPLRFLFFGSIYEGNLLQYWRMVHTLGRCSLQNVGHIGKSCLSAQAIWPLNAKHTNLIYIPAQATWLPNAKEFSLTHPPLQTIEVREWTVSDSHSYAREYIYTK
jgi:hypothetical protein